MQALPWLLAYQSPLCLPACLEPLEPLLDLQQPRRCTWSSQAGGFHVGKMAHQSLCPTAEAPAVVVLGLQLDLEELLDVKILSGRCPITVAAWRSWQLPPQRMLLQR